MFVELLLLFLKELLLFANGVIEQGNEFLFFTNVSTQKYELMLDILFLGECANVNAYNIILHCCIFFLQVEYSFLEISLQLGDLELSFFQSGFQLLNSTLIMLILSWFYLGGCFF